LLFLRNYCFGYHNNITGSSQVLVTQQSAISNKLANKKLV